MRYLLIISAALGLTSCNPDDDTTSDMNVLLTSEKWSITEKSINNTDLKTTVSFDEDGSYRVEYQDESAGTKILTVKGTWKWISTNELSIMHQTLVVEGVDYKTRDTQEDAYIIRITELSKNNFKGIQRYNKDSEDSGFAKTVSYTSQTL